jgi:uncharacterized protein with PQ loop repeat
MKEHLFICLILFELVFPDPAREYFMCILQMTNPAVPYSAIGISVFARFIFMYLLYTKKSVNSLSLTFCILNIASSGLWLKYSLETRDMPLTVRNAIDGVLLAISAAYILRNRYEQHAPLPFHDMGVVNPEPESNDAFCR